MATIGIMDSGYGGMSVQTEIQKVLPNEHYIYYADTAYCPYGEKTPEFIRQRCASITEEFIERGADIIVVACNTATAAAISWLRSTYNIPFIGMEPAVKPAVSLTKSGIIGVLATEGTLKGEKYLNMKKKYSSQATIVENVGKGYVEIVENIFSLIDKAATCIKDWDLCNDCPSKTILNDPKTYDTIKSSLKPLLDAGSDTIVLGCTHYPFVLPILKDIAGPDVTFINPAPAVASHLLEVLEEQGIKTNAEGEGSFELINSKDKQTYDYSRPNKKS